jgi:hypothetical protein
MKSEMNETDEDAFARNIVALILVSLKSRSGIENAFDDIDQGTMMDIRESLREIVKNETRRWFPADK